MDAAALLKRLETIDWFEGYPEPAKAKTKAAIAEAGALTPIRGDVSGIEGEGRYSAILDQIAEQSGGLFQPRLIEEDWDDDEDEDFALTFLHGTTRFRARFSSVDEDIDPAVFALVAKALATATPPLTLHVCAIDGQAFTAAIATPAAIQRAVDAKLLPKA
mgnify:CR=1 FL=1